MNNQRAKPKNDIFGLIVFLTISLTVSVIGGAITTSSVGNWFPTLNKPEFNPPNWVFGPVWALLYLLMAVAAWRVWRCAGFRKAKLALIFFFSQLALNLAWSFLFFGMRRVDLALIDIVFLLFAIVLTAILFWRIDRVASMLFVPYILWVSFATYLNLSIWVLN